MENKKQRISEAEYDAVCEYRKSFGKRFMPKEQFKRGKVKSYRARLSDEEQKIVDKIRNGEAEVELPNTDNRILKEIESRYSINELSLLAKGEGLMAKDKLYSPIRLHGKHHRIGIISDTHLGSKYTPEEWVINAFSTFEKEKCECVLHCGDVTDGLCSGRAKTHIYELSHIGYDAQKKYSIEILSRCKIQMYVLSGNHDAWYKELGADIVKDICDAIPNATYLGNNQADIELDGATIRLFHGLDGNSYAISYRLQKLIEGFSGGKKPNILLCGHTHKMAYIFERNIQAVSVPSLQAQTPWMAGKKISAHTGFLIIDFDVLNGNVCNFQVKLYPYYE